MITFNLQVNAAELEMIERALKAYQEEPSSTLLGKTLLQATMGFEVSEAWAEKIAAKTRVEIKEREFEVMPLRLKIREIQLKPSEFQT